MANFDEHIAKANKGNRYSQLLVGEHYLSKGNAELAAEWLTKAAEREDAKAQYHLSFLHFKGMGVTRDYEKAADYLKRSAENDYVPAQTQLGSLYIQGQGVAQDEQMGLFWSRRAAAAGSEIAMFNLGVAYFRGIGMSKNIDKSREYLFRALKKGYKPAKEILLSESEVFRSETDDSDKDYMSKLVASAEAEAEIDAIASSLGDTIESDEIELSESVDLVSSDIVKDSDQATADLVTAPADLASSVTLQDREVEELAAVNFDDDNDDDNEDDEDDNDEDDEDEDEDGEDDDEDDDKNENADDDENDERDDEKNGDKPEEGFFTKVKRFLHKMFAE